MSEVNNRIFDISHLALAHQFTVLPKFRKESQQINEQSVLA